MKKNAFISMIMAVVVWVACLAIGFELSQRRPLWGDELFTQNRSIEPQSYQKLFLGRISEGNNCPLFYVLQKRICYALHYQYPGTWYGEWFVYEHRSQVILRMLSNVLMSASIALIFYFFARSYSLGVGFFAVVAVLVAPMVWMYWVENRPYALWFFLTTLQSMLLLGFFEKPERSARGWLWLALVHLLLVLTIRLGAAQVLIASALLWFFIDRQWWRYALLTAVPISVAMFYYSNAPKYNFFFREGPVELLLQSIPLEYLMFFLFYLFVLSVSFFSQRIQCLAKNRDWKIPHILFLILSFMSAAALLFYLKLNDKSGPVGFAISSRYFISLIPVTVMVFVLFVLDLWRVFEKNLWMRVNVVIVVGGLLALRILKTYISVMASGTFMHVIR